MSFINTMPELSSLLAGADHVDVKTIESTATLREFISGMMAFQPAWVTALYGIRSGFVRLLGMKQERQPVSMRVAPAAVPITPGAPAVFFTVRDAAEDRYWIAEIKDKHLNAALGVVVEAVDESRRRFHVLTVVHYNHWTGPVYFNVIRPFHHLVVGSMARAGAKGAVV